MSDTRTRLYIVRHGETEWNKTLRYQGHRDIPLSEEGRVQAAQIAKRLSGEKLHAAYASDLSRALETAEAISEYHGLDVARVPELKETNFGLWEGLTYGEIDRQFHSVMKEWYKNPRDTQIPGGESLGEVADRCQAGIDRILSENPGKNVLVVAHGGIIRIIVATVLGMSLNDYWKIKQDNVSLNIVEFFEPERAILCLLNDTAHLGMTNHG
ncbi:alpha-ribazole phosphatase [Phosphitispora fastidiosa]|uniref:alpha-ribazole phosphatase n=1 Tax=Phosphitispora fastidiosa TaxID=2837202 RepID=UPI001E5FCE0F|nr:alpha-ribazole phosphatase [Phosphitispora fastidiosa]MBU7005228.1 alpha-ribazole phosphatase [Phosphitispora fastidiosa]